MVFIIVTTIKEPKSTPPIKKPIGASVANEDVEDDAKLLKKLGGSRFCILIFYRLNNKHYKNKC